MAKVTYRGVVYDTNNKKSTEKKVSELTYRGIKHSAKQTVNAQSYEGVSTPSFFV